MAKTRHVFIAGLGFTGLRLARALIAQGSAVSGTMRDPHRCALLREEGITAWPFPLPDPALALQGITHLVSTIPPGADGDPVLAAHGAVVRAAADLRWAGYLSTTGVYGDHGGGWVDEGTLPAPLSARSAHRLQAEQAWQGIGVPLTVFRLPGIYGPGRSAFDQLRAGTARRIDRPGHVFSRIHVDDIVGALLAAMARPPGLGVINVVDDEPAEPRAVIEYACGLLGADLPPLTPFDAGQMTPMARSFWAESKRVSNARLKSALGYTLRYASYREGLQAILAVR
jgi:nucleoside-diphosphate-sugar epimerase